MIHKADMNLLRIIGAVLAQLLLATAVYPQPPPVHQMYDRTWRITRVKSEHLILVNSPEQFLELQLIAAWPGESRDGPPQRILMELTSRTLKPIYRGQDRRLFVTDGTSTSDLGPLSLYGLYHQISADAPDIYDFRDATVARIPIPRTAQVLAGYPGSLLTAEILHTQDIQVSQIANMAHAKNLVLRLESTLIDLGEDQMTVLRAFEKSLALPNESSQKTKIPEGRSQNGIVPLDLATAPLDLTLSWLKQQLAASGRMTALSGALVQTGIEDISGCRVTFRVDNLNDEAPEDNAILKPTTHYIVNLADLNPESAIITTTSADSTILYSTIKFATHDSKRTVQIFTRQQVIGKEFDKRLDYSLAIQLPKDAPVSGIRNAMAQAIRLCHLQP